MVRRSSVTPPPTTSKNIINRSSMMRSLEQYSVNFGTQIITLDFSGRPDPKSESYLNRAPPRAFPKVFNSRWRGGKYTWDCNQFSSNQQCFGAQWAYIDDENLEEPEKTMFENAKRNGQLENQYRGRYWAYTYKITIGSDCLCI